MIHGVLSPLGRKRAQKIACCLLAALLLCALLPAARAETGAEGADGVSLRAEVDQAEGGAFLRLYLLSPLPIDSFLIRLHLDPDRGTLAGDPVVEAPLRYGYSFAHAHASDDGDVIAAYCSAMGFITEKPILTLPVQFEKGAEPSPALLSCGEGSALTVLLGQKRAQRAYGIYAEGDGFVAEADSAQGAEVMSGAAPLARQLRNGIEDVTGNELADEADIMAQLLCLTGAVSDIGEIAPLLRLPLLGEKHLERFSYAGAVRSRNAYRSDMVSCELKTYKEKRLTYYTVEIFIRDIHCLRTALGRATFGRAEKILLTAQRNNALYAINGDCYFARKVGLLMQNGTLYRNSIDKKRDIAVLFEDGTLEVIPPDRIDLAALQARGAYQIWSFGPGLLTAEGDAIRSNDGFSDKKLAKENPRTAFGCVEPGHYWFVVVDGRGAGGSKGMEMKDLSILMHSLGCTVAYNLDGGGTSGLVSAEYGNISKSADTSRSCSDIIYVIDDPA